MSIYQYCHIEPFSQRKLEYIFCFHSGWCFFKPQSLQDENQMWWKQRFFGSFLANAVCRDSLNCDIQKLTSSRNVEMFLINKHNLEMTKRSPFAALSSTCPPGCMNWRTIRWQKLSTDSYIARKQCGIPVPLRSRERAWKQEKKN